MEGAVANLMNWLLIAASGRGAGGQLPAQQLASWPCLAGSWNSWRSRLGPWGRREASAQTLPWEAIGRGEPALCLGPQGSRFSG